MCNPIGYKPVTDLERNRLKCLESCELAKPLTLAAIELVSLEWILREPV